MAENHLKRWTWEIKFEPRDVWIGVFWQKGLRVRPPKVYWHFYICILPMVPIHIYQIQCYERMFTTSY